MAFLSQRHLCRRQYLGHLSAILLSTILQDRSPDRGDTQKAPVRSRPALPTERQAIGGPFTRIWPWRATPVGCPTRRTRASRASTGLALGQGCSGLQLPSISRVAIPDSRMRGPSAHQIGPSPSQTCVGVQVNVRPAAMTWVSTLITRWPRLNHHHQCARRTQYRHGCTVAPARSAPKLPSRAGHVEASEGDAAANRQ